MIRDEAFPPSPSPYLEHGEDGKVDLVLKAAVVLAEKDHAGARAAHGLVGGGGDHVAELKGVVGLLRGHQTANVGHVAHQQRTAGVRNLAEGLVVPVARVGAEGGGDGGSGRISKEGGAVANSLSPATADDHARLEEVHGLSQLIKVNEAGLRVDLREVERSGCKMKFRKIPILSLAYAVRQGLEEDGGSANLLGGAVLGVVGVVAVRAGKFEPFSNARHASTMLVAPMGQVATGGQVQAHDAVVGVQEACGGSGEVRLQDDLLLHHFPTHRCRRPCWPASRCRAGR